MAADLEKSIFLSALDRETPEQREAYLAEACGDDAALRRAVEELLAAHGRSQNVLDRMPEAVAAARAGLEAGSGLETLDAPGASAAPNRGADRSGEMIGRYRLMEKIGEGGFGQVYVAQQQYPVRRQVALKLLKPGMNSHEVIARFEAERQALARMDHPNIATVFDAGEIDAGQPYFVMELVRGVPITQFCDQRRLAMRERLELFIDVCQAVQHAHQKGIIHRDLKPSNILVTLLDGRAIPKVIDFGIAKATNGHLTDES
ncbi:MAG: serine/threonine protein kinase, partial [Planctomycetes bacterium]|nr:serine/threonine protein kinase [Planctomycetota bacterium]